MTSSRGAAAEEDAVVVVEIERTEQHRSKEEEDADEGAPVVSPSTSPAPAPKKVPRPPWWKDGAMRRLVAMATLTLLFCVGEIVFGVLTNSLAVLSDAFHMISDSGALVLGLFARRISGRRNTRTMSYGWSRAEVIGGLCNGVFLISVTFFVAIEAVQRFIDIPEIDNPIMLIIIGGAGLLVNLLGLVLFAGHAHIGHNHGHSHGHGHSHSHSHEKEKKEEGEGTEASAAAASKKKKKKEVNVNLHGLFLHIMGDALGSVCAIVVGLCILLIKGSWKYYLDPTLSLVICAVILNSSIPLVKSCVRVLMQSVPDNVDLEKLLAEIRGLEGAAGVHDLHVWQMTQSTHIGTMHISCDRSTDFMELASRVKKVLHKHNIHATTIQPEFWSPTTSPAPRASHVHAEPGIQPAPECLLCCEDEAKSDERRSLLQRHAETPAADDADSSAAAASASASAEGKK